MFLDYIMALTRRKQRRSRQTMRAGAPPAAGAIDAAKYINYNLAELNEALDKLSGVFGGKNKDYFEDYDLTAVKQKTTELFEELDALEQMIKNTKYYDPDQV
jgi:uncharacterized protein YukE